MSGFTRRYDQFPGTEVLQEIEGVVTIDQNAPGAISGVSAGVACLVGEFADMTYGVAIDANGVVTTSPQPVEVFSGQDLTTKVGGWDETIGDFGGTGGSGFIEVKNKGFSRLIVIPVNLASSQGARLFRKLPTNKSATDPSPVVPVVGATVVAGREFKTGSNRVRTAQAVTFSEVPAFKTGIDGAATAAGSTATSQAFSSAGGGFTTVTRPDGTVGLKVGDICVLGVIAGAGALGANADTYRVKTVDSDTQVHLEKMDGTVFDWTTGTNLPFRFLIAATADSGGQVAIATQTGFRVPCRPLDATIAANANLTPTIVPAALTSSGADPLSGLAMKTDTSVGLVFTANVQAPNVASNSNLDALYATALDSVLQDDLPEREANILWAARSSATIDLKLSSVALTRKSVGMGMMTVFSPPLSVLSPSTAMGDASPGVGNTRYREGQYCWPGLQTFIGDAVGFSIKGADGLTYTNGILDVPSQSWLAAIESRLPPERNPGQSADPVKSTMALALGVQRGISGLDVNAYKQLKAKGVCAPRNDRTVGRIFQSGVTRSIKSGEREIYTRRFSFFVEDSVASFLLPYSKEMMSEALKDQLLGALHDFFDDLLSQNNPSAARIRGFAIDGKNGNTKELTAAGIFVVKYAVEMILIANTIVQQAQVGYGVLDVSQLAG